MTCAVVGFFVQSGLLFVVWTLTTATDGASRDAESRLDAALRLDGLMGTPDAPSSLAQYNEPLTNPLQRRNEVLVPLVGFDKGKL